MKRAHVLISGRVQGIYFRVHTQSVANQLGLTGWVKNLPDGRVEAVFEGLAEVVRQMIEWCRQGPSGARVDRVDLSWEDFRREFQGFSIRR